MRIVLLSFTIKLSAACLGRFPCSRRVCCSLIFLKRSVCFCRIAPEVHEHSVFTIRVIGARVAATQRLFQPSSRLAHSAVQPLGMPRFALERDARSCVRRVCGDFCTDDAMLPLQRSRLLMTCSGLQLQDRKSVV
jgi:hypothetical protein